MVVCLPFTPFADPVPWGSLSPCLAGCAEAAKSWLLITIFQGCICRDEPLRMRQCLTPGQRGSLPTARSKSWGPVL